MVNTNESRDAQESSGFIYLGKMFDSSSIAVARISIASLCALVSIQNNVPFSINWTAQDNSVITLNAAQMIQMPIALAGYSYSLHLKAAALKLQINTATTIKEIDNILWT